MQGALIYADAASIVLFDKCIILHDKTTQTDYFSQGTIIFRDTELPFERANMHTTSVFPAASTGLCPSFTIQEVSWKCIDSSRSYPNCRTSGDNAGQYPWGVKCGTCPTSTTEIALPDFSEYPHLSWACQCAEGKFGSECKHCPSNTFSPSKSTVVLTRCIPCSSGFFASEGSSRCISCIPGQFRSTLNMCTNCPVGYFQTKMNSGNCTVCPAGKYQQQQGQAFCFDCIPGQFRSTTAYPTPFPTPIPTLSPTSAGSSYGDSSYSSSPTFTPTLAPTAAPTSHPSQIPTLTMCTNCPVGYFQTKMNSGNCTVCPAGKYQQQQGQAFCSSCPAGMHQPDSNTTSCLSCGAGHYQPNEEEPSCELCPEGKYQDAILQPYCLDVKPGKLVRSQLNASGTLVSKEWDCPSVGMECNFNKRIYSGSVWHDPHMKYPKRLYTCVNEGCPDAGSASMQCKEGYDNASALCAVCSDGYFGRLRKCIACPEPRIAEALGFALAISAIAGALLYTAWKHRDLLRTMTAFSAHGKIVVSFVTIASTIQGQFGVVWPESFSRALAALSFVSLDFGALSAYFCVVRVSFYDTLLSTTLLLVVFLVLIFTVSRYNPKLRQECLTVAVYLLLFAYPIVAVKVVHTFGCHAIQRGADESAMDVYYLRSDYGIVCYTPEWKTMAAYASVYIVLYVTLFPLWIITRLRSYQAAVLQTKTTPNKLLLGFLLNDYKHEAVCYTWEAIELLRKLLLSTIGAMWSDQSAMAITMALLIAITFSSLHFFFQPYKHQSCNRLQSYCLSVLTLMYLSGLLLHMQAVEHRDQQHLGALLVAMVVGTIVLFAVGMASEMRLIWHSIRKARRCADILKALPRLDPPDDTAAFYRIQCPVEENNMGLSFCPKAPEQLCHIEPLSKVRVLRLLTKENEGRLDDFFERFHRDWAVPLQRVKTTDEVNVDGNVLVKHSCKTNESILAKAQRPAILAKNPNFGVEHVRDSFRFKCVVHSFRDCLAFIHAMAMDEQLFPDGMSARDVAKLDIDKLRTPKEWGWRFVAFDFVMPNMQIVECYIVFQKMEQAKKLKCPDASVCSEDSNHEIFERWRVEDVGSLDDNEMLRRYHVEREESNRRYDSAFEDVMLYTSSTEANAFWDVFGALNDKAAGSGFVTAVMRTEKEHSLADGETFSQSNPLQNKMDSTRKLMISQEREPECNDAVI